MSVQDPSVRTSRTFDAALAVYDKLAAATFAAHSVTGITPEVHLFSDPTWEEGEYITVRDGTTPATSEWVSASSATSEERLTVDVVIRSMVPAVTSERTVVARLEALADVVQLIAYDVAAGKPKALGFDNESRTGRASSVSWSLARTPEGFVGEATVRFRLMALI
jgi:hypothetical protein